MTRQALELNDTDVTVRLYMALELSDGKWKAVIGDNRRAPSQHSVSAGEARALLAVIEKAKKRCGLSGAGTGGELLRGGARRLLVTSMAGRARRGEFGGGFFEY